MEQCCQFVLPANEEFRTVADKGESFFRMAPIFLRGFMSGFISRQSRSESLLLGNWNLLMKDDGETEPRKSPNQRRPNVDIRGFCRARCRSIWTAPQASRLGWQRCSTARLPSQTKNPNRRGDRTALARFLPGRFAGETIGRSFVTRDPCLWNWAETVNKQFREATLSNRRP